AHARYPEATFEAIAVTAVGTDGHELDEPASPCGACRQALMEYEHLAGHPVPVYLAGRHKVYKLPSVSSLLPFTFVEF
ncbi:MAG: cytidine deaminase, partial [Muribaculaceae bacterium]|nr:cytidine deaminase [Muribaculaceae bacterium]